MTFYELVIISVIIFIIIFMIRRKIRDNFRRIYTIGYSHNNSSSLKEKIKQLGYKYHGFISNRSKEKEPTFDNDYKTILSEIKSLAVDEIVVLISEVDADVSPLYLIGRLNLDLNLLVSVVYI